MQIGLFDQILGGDALVGVHATDGVGEEFGHGEDGGLAALLVEGDGVGEDHLGKSAVVDALGSGVAHDGVRSEGTHRFCSLGEHQVGGLGDGAGGVDHVVDEDYVLVFDVADYCHCSYHVGFSALLVAEHQGHVEVLGVAVGTLGASYIGGGDH